MSTKDWKNDGYMKWRKKDFGIMLEKAFLSDEYIIVILSYNKDNFTDGNTLKSFKTKSQALKFAKSYMRTH